MRRCGRMNARGQVLLPYSLIGMLGSGSADEDMKGRRQASWRRDRAEGDARRACHALCPALLVFDLASIVSTRPVHSTK